MDFESNPINISIWKYINEEKKRLKSGTPFITFDVPLSGKLYPHTVNDLELMNKIIKIDENKRAEFLNGLVKALSVKEKIKLMETLVKSLNPEEFTFFDRATVANLINN